MIRGNTHATLNGPNSLPNAALRNPAPGKTQSPAPQAPAAPSLSPRRDSHTDHPVAMPGGRERGSGGGGNAGHGRQGFEGHSDMNSWMPVSAQMSPLSRLPRAAMAPAHALRAFNPIGRLHFPMAAIGFAFDLVTSIFRRSPAHVHADRRDHRDASHERAQEKRQRVRQHRKEDHVDVHAYRNDTRQADSTQRVFAENPGGGKRGPVPRRHDNSPLLA